jgi:hypothetical protein
MNYTTIYHQDIKLAVILHSNFNNEGVNFISEDNDQLQIAFMKHPKGKYIQPHIHNKIKREVFFTPEVLLVKIGKIQVNFYTDEKIYIKSCVLETGDTIVLLAGGHGFEILEDTTMIEVKQGPYLGEIDKTKFTV